MPAAPRSPQASAGAASRATRRWRHQLGTIAKMPKAQPSANAARTMMTIGARHSWSKNQCTLASCWLFSAKAKRAKKTATRTSQTTRRI